MLEGVLGYVRGCKRVWVLYLDPVDALEESLLWGDKVGNNVGKYVKGEVVVLVRGGVRGCVRGCVWVCKGV